MASDKDIITGLDRYEEFLVKLAAAIEQMKQEDFHIAIVYSDIQHFKYINDTYGYQHGDMLLREFCATLTKDNPWMLCAARVYSDNIVFAIKLPGDLDNGAFRDYIYKRNLDMQSVFREKFMDEQLTFCTGISVLTKDDRRLDPATAVSNANLARKVAKENQDEKCILFDKKMMEGIKREVEITSSIPKAIKNHELQVYYQPKVSSQTGQVIGAEALVRWRKPDGSFVYPDQFIPVIEQSGQIVEVDYFVYREVFRFIADRLAEGKTVVPISVNVSRMHLHKMKILEYVQGLFEEYQIPPKYVEFEITESIYIDNTDKALQLVEGFHAMNTKVSMDDFGSGYSSLNLLSQLPIDVIKLDKAFLKSEELQENEKVIIACMVDLAKRLRITSLCEGVETLGQSDYLSSVGCEIQQGFYFSRPVPVEEFEKFIEKE